MTTFGEQIKVLRQEKDFTIREFAKLVNLSPGYISQLERNKASSPPSEENVRKIANILEYDEYQLLALAKRIPVEVQEAYFADPNKVVYLCRKIKGDSDEL